MNTQNTILVQDSNAIVQSKSKRKKGFLKKRMIMLAVMLIHSFGAFATTVNGQIDTWKDTVKAALDAAVFVFAVVGAFLIFVQYMQGNEQAQKNLIRFVIGLAVFGLADLIAGAFLTAGP